MAKQLSKVGVTDGALATAAQVTQSIDALTGDDAYDITISGSLTVTGSTDINGVLSIPGFPDVSSSLANSGGGGVGFPFTGSAKITGSLELTGSTNILASEGSNLTLEVNESAQFEFLTGAPNTGSFIVQTSPDTGKGALQSYFGQGTGTVFTTTIPNQLFGLKYTTGSIASEGELSMTFGKRDLSGLGSPTLNMNNFYVAYEPGGIFSNAQGELEFYVGEHPDVSSGVILQYRGGLTAVSQTSSYAGYFSSSAFPNQQLHTRPFAISATSTVNDSNPAFVINKDITDLTTSNFSVDYGGNVTAAGNGLFQAGKSIITHTSSPISSSLTNAGKYHIVGGTLTASIVLDSTAPIGAEYEFFQTSSTGQFLFESASGTTLISKNGSLRLAQQGSSAVLKKVTSTTFHLMGDLLHLKIII